MRRKFTILLNGIKIKMTLIELILIPAIAWIVQRQEQTLSKVSELTVELAELRAIFEHHDHD